jgi:hypothetical protein
MRAAAGPASALSDRRPAEVGAGVEEGDEIEVPVAACG